MNTKNMKNQYEFMEHVLLNVDFTTQEEVVEYAEKLLKALDKMENVSPEHREIFEEGVNNFKGLTLEQLKDLKNVITE